MKSVFGWALVCGITFTGMSTLSAQHLHQHGNHFDVHQNVQHGHDRAGHLTDSLGHHIDGHGRHTGMTGVYENGARDHRLNSHNLRYGAGYGLNYSSGYGVYNSPYSSRYYSGGYATPYSLNSGIGYSGLRLSIGNSGFGYSSSRLPYVAPSQVFIAPQQQVLAPAIVASPAAPLGNRVVVNKIPAVKAVPGNAAKAPQGGMIVLRNPSTSGGNVSYVLNTFNYTIKPGESQKIAADREWKVQFDNGLGQTVSYDLQPGVFEFNVSAQTGWTVERVIAEQDETPESIEVDAN